MSRVGELDINKLAKYEIEKIEAESFGILYLMKKEYEEQLELKHKHVEKYWKTILLIIKAKLKDQVLNLKVRKVMMFGLQLWRKNTAHLN